MMVETSNRLFGIDLVKSSGGIKSLFGTAFAIDKRRIVTASHILDQWDGKSKLEFSQPSRSSLKGEIETIDKAADLALFKLEDAIAGLGVLQISEEIPPIGTPCYWGGFARVLGEPFIRRARFARGIISSEPYGHENATFFDLDGVFNPGHSGAPIINYETGHLIGVVSQSAGNVIEYLTKARIYNDAVQLLSTHMDVLWEVIDSINGMTEVLMDVVSKIENRLGLSLLSPSYGPSGEWTAELDGKTDNSILKVLKAHGLKVEKKTRGGLFGGSRTEYFHLSASVSEFFRAVIQLLLKVVEHNEFALDESFQMGIGVATGGAQLSNLLGQ